MALLVLSFALIYFLIRGLFLESTQALLQAQWALDGRKYLLWLRPFDDSGRIFYQYDRDGFPVEYSALRSLELAAAKHGRLTALGWSDYPEAQHYFDLGYSRVLTVYEKEEVWEKTLRRLANDCRCIVLFPWKKRGGPVVEDGVSREMRIIASDPQYWSKTVVVIHPKTAYEWRRIVEANPNLKLPPEVADGCVYRAGEGLSMGDKVDWEYFRPNYPSDDRSKALDRSLDEALNSLLPADPGKPACEFVADIDAINSANKPTLWRRIWGPVTRRTRPRS